MLIKFNCECGKGLKFIFSSINEKQEQQLHVTKMATARAGAHPAVRARDHVLQHTYMRTTLSKLHVHHQYPLSLYEHLRTIIW